MRQHLVRAASFLANEVGVQEVLFVGGVALLAYGMSLIWLPGAFIIPGSILTAVAVFGVR
jgi:hypothetical protein